MVKGILVARRYLPNLVGSFAQLAIRVLFFLLIGRALDAAMRAKTAGAAANLIGLQAVTASVLREGDRIERLSARLVAPGDRMLVAAGERIAVDGVVRSGSSEIDE